jgi:TP901 family phage tail tape measure protein
MDRNLRLNLIFKAAGNAKTFLQGVKGESDRTSKALGAARERVTDLQKSVRNIAAYKRLQGELGQTQARLAEAQKEAQRLGQAHASADRPTRQLTRALEIARDKVRGLQEQEQRRRLGLQDLRGTMTEAGISTKNLSAHEMRLGRELREANGELREQARQLEAVAARQQRLSAARTRYDSTQQLAGTMQGAGMSSVAAGGALAAPLFMGGRQAMSFEDGMLDVAKVVDFETPLQFRQMSNDILDLATHIPIANEGLTAIVAAAGQASIPRAELLGFAEDAAKMGIAFDTTAEQSGSMMATWRTAFRMTQPEVRGLADQINYLGNTGPANAMQISNIVTRIGPLGEVAGMAAGEIAALGSTMAGMGLSDEIAATGIKNTVLALTKGEAATRMQRQAWKALGLDAVTVARQMQQDAGGTILDVLGRISKLAPDRQSAILTQLFGSESVGAIAPMLTNLELLEENLGKVADSSLYAGSMQKEFESRAKAASNAVQLGKEGFKALGVEIGTTFLPQIKAGALALRDGANRLRAFAQANPGVIKVVGTLVAVLAAGLVVFGGLAMAAAAVLGPFALLQLTLTQTAVLFGPVLTGLKLMTMGVWRFTAALLANPMVLIATLIIAAVAAVAYVIYRNWGRIGPWLKGLWDGITRTVSGGLGLIKAYILNFTPLGFVIRNWQPIVGFVRALWNLIGQAVGLGLDYAKYLLARFSPMPHVRKAWSGVTGHIASVWAGARGVVRKGLSVIGQGLLRFTPLGFIVRNWDAISSFLLMAFDRYRSTVQYGLEAIGQLLLRFTPLGFIISNWGPISGFVVALWNRVQGAVSSGIDVVRNVIRAFNPLEAFKSAFATLWTWLQELPGKLLKAGADAMDGFARGIRGRRAEVQAATAEVARVPEATTRRVTQTRSPSRVMMNVGRDVMSGFTLGLGQDRRGPAGVMAGAAAALIAAGSVSMPGLRAGGIEGQERDGLEAAAAFGRADPASLARPAFDTGPRLSARPTATLAASSRTSGPPAIGELKITIVQRSGEDAEALARRVAELLRKPDLSSLSDDPDYGEA